MTTDIELETDRLLLKPMRESDARMVVHWRNLRHISKFGFSSAKKPISLNDHILWFRNTRNIRIDYIIFLKAGMQGIGSLSYTFRELSGKNCAEIGKYIGETSMLGRGYATEATDCWLKFGFDDLKLDCVFARVHRSNTVNIRVNVKLGFSIAPYPSDLNSESSDWLFMRINTYHCQ